MLGELVFVAIPVEYLAHLTAAGAAFLVGGLQASVSAELAGLWIITHMAGLNDQQVLAVSGMWAVASIGDDTADAAMIERKDAEMLADHDDRVTLAFIGTESAGRHDFAGFKSQRFAPVIDTGDKQVIPHHPALYLETSDKLYHIRC